MTEKQTYRVLARKYRPATFADLVGQEVLVKILSNAINIDRISHAFILTGTRGIGKTTTARILARSLNCIGGDGKGSMTPDPCGHCENCKSINDNSHVDVIEVDAASHTGVANIREIIDNVRYKPLIARYKVYVIDEVHMLSTAAFNALLKTLEEPPSHIVFILATTEIRKVPVTVLSRCQRFDLRRLSDEQMSRHLSLIAKKESVIVEEKAIALITRSAEGSVRDGLSLLDQAISLCGKNINEDQIRKMLGLANRSGTISLFEASVSAKPEEALNILKEQFIKGLDPVIIIQDLMEFCHWLTRCKILGKNQDDMSMSDSEKNKGEELAHSISMAELTKVWQLLVKGIGEIQSSDLPLVALEMLIVRIVFASELPDPSILVRMEQESKKNKENSSNFSLEKTEKKTKVDKLDKINSGIADNNDNKFRNNSNEEKSKFDNKNSNKVVDSFLSMIKLAEEEEEYILRSHLISNVHLVNFSQGNISIRLKDETPSDFVKNLGNMLTKSTGIKWLISLSDEEGNLTVKETNKMLALEEINRVTKHPLVKETFDIFPGAEIKKIRETNNNIETSSLNIEEEAYEKY